MRNLDVIRKRYLQDSLPVRLGGLATNLSRIASFSKHTGNYEVINRLLEESKFLIEWTILDTTLDVQVKLVELQLQLALWHRVWLAKGPINHTKMTRQLYTWSKQVLKMSGLLEVSGT